MKTMPTYYANIYVGLREGYDGPRHFLTEVQGISSEYCDEVGLCVTVTFTTFVYKGGHEGGAVVGLINYPRFPKPVCQIRMHALTLAERLRDRLGQLRVTVEFTDDTVMIGED